MVADDVERHSFEEVNAKKEAQTKEEAMWRHRNKKTRWTWHSHWTYFLSTIFFVLVFRDRVMFKELCKFRSKGMLVSNVLWVAEGVHYSLSDLVRDILRSFDILQMKKVSCDWRGYCQYVGKHPVHK
jgi:hypothetical protein